MALDIEGIAREVLTAVLQGGNGSSSIVPEKSSSNGGLSGMKGLAAGAGAAALAPAAFKAAKKLADGLGVDGLTDAVKSPGEAVSGATSKLGDRVASGAKDKAEEALGEAGGPSGMLKDAAKGMLPFGGGGGGGGTKGGAEGVGKGRRMPVQQSVDIGLPIETVYNQWTQFEEWPKFMHRVTRATQDDPCTVSFATKIWGRTKEFKAKIDTQRPDERIKWKVSEGMTHTGVVTFHELGPNLTRVMIGFDVDPGSLVEKFARGARHIKRAARADLHRFKALIETAEHETGAWRGVIEDGELVEDHDPSYDQDREYSDIAELTGEQDSDDDQDDDEQESRGANRGRSRAAASSKKQATKRGRSGSQSRGRQSSRKSQSSGSKSRSSGRKSSGAQKSRSSASKSQSSGRKASSSRKSSGTRKSSGATKSQSGSRSRSSGGSTRASSGGRSRGSGGSSNGRSRSGSRTRSRSRNS